MLSINCILCPTDFSEHSRYGFEAACALARDYKARLVIMHAYVPPEAFGNMLVPGFDAASRESAQTNLRRIAPSGTNIEVAHRFVDGFAASEIVKCAKQEHCDLIVIGTHGHSGWRRVLMGSTAEQVLRAAPCPVLTVTRPAERESDKGSLAYSESPTAAVVPSQPFDELLSVLQLQAKEVERLIAHVEQYTAPLTPTSALPLVTSQLSALRAQLREYGIEQRATLSFGRVVASRSDS